MQKKTFLTIGVSALALLAVSGIFVHGHKMEKATGAQVVRATNRAQKQRNLDDATHLKVRHQLFGHALTSNDPTIKSIAINSDDNNTIHKPFLKFFNVFYNWKNHQDYVSRPKQLRNIANNNVLSNRTFFGKDRDSSNGSIIDNEQLNCEFNDMTLYILSHKGTDINVLADVQYNSWHTETDNQATGEQWFAMNYNTKTKKITSMKKLYNQKNVNNDND